MKKIFLTQNKVALVDDEDFYEMNKHKWYFSTGYAMFKDGYKKRHATQMHRLIMKCPKGFDIDHKNHNGLDNRRENLRICTRQDNMRNRLGKNGGYKGARLVKGRWRSEHTLNKKTVHIGYFDTQIEAAQAYDNKVREIYGEFAKLNFPI
jgi:hypothetical protein